MCRPRWGWVVAGGGWVGRWVGGRVSEWDGELGGWLAWCAELGCEPGDLGQGGTLPACAKPPALAPPALSRRPRFRLARRPSAPLPPRAWERWRWVWRRCPSHPRRRLPSPSPSPTPPRWSARSPARWPHLLSTLAGPLPRPSPPAPCPAQPFRRPHAPRVPLQPWRPRLSASPHGARPPLTAWRLLAPCAPLPCSPPPSPVPRPA